WCTLIKSIKPAQLSKIACVKRKDKWQKARRGGIGRDPAGKSGLAWAKMQILADPGGPNLRRG
ncbi:MAG TPA: hypothetical protein PLB76_11520, partial [Anaerohalosphaeraceae bacterium]|nr:hypothetical protein [Anaerohalosphaeraceae bacterium]